MKNEKAICYESYLKMLSAASSDLLEAYACRDGESAKYCQGYKTLAFVYPALANLAEELNLNYGAEIRFADGQDLEFTEKSEAFYDLSRQIQKTISQKKEFVNVPDLYDAFSDDIVSQLNTVSEILQNPDNGLDEEKCRYWFRNSLILSQELLKNQRKSRIEQLFDDIDNRNIGEQLAEAIKNTGVMVKESQIDDICGVLYDVGEDFSYSHRQIDKNAVVQAIVPKIKEECCLGKDEKDFFEPVMQNVDDFISLVRETRTEIRKINSPIRSINLAMQSLEKGPDNKRVRRLIYQNRLKFGGVPSFQVSDEAMLSWDKAEVLPEYLEAYRTDERFQKVNSKLGFWKKYEEASKEAKSEPLKAYMRTVVTQWVNLVSEDFYKFKENRDLILDNLDGKDQEDEDEQPLSGQNVVIGEIKKDTAVFAKKLLSLSKASEKYVNVVLNTSGVSAKDLAQVPEEGAWSSNHFKAVDLILDSVSDNFEDKGYLFNQNEAEAVEDALDLIIALPHSAEKREMLSVIKEAFEKVSDEAFEEQETLRLVAAGYVEIEHEDIRENLNDFLAGGAEGFSDLKNTDLDGLAEEIDEAVTSNYILPMYHHEDKSDKALELSLMQIPGYEFYSPETKRFISSLVRYHAKELTLRHRHLIAEDEFSPSITRKTAVYYDSLDRFGAVEQKLNKIDDALAVENGIYEKYQAFCKEKEIFNVSDDLVLKMLARSKFCYN